MAREFARSEISATPFANEMPPLNDAFKKLQAGGFADWRLTVDGMVDRPGMFSLDQLKSYPSRSQITQLACEEGWSYVAEWTGVPLSHVLEAAGIQPQAKYVVYFSIDPDWWDSIDMGDALHPQTYLAYGMNGGDLPVGQWRAVAHAGSAATRVQEREVYYPPCGYRRSRKFGKGLGSASPEGGYAWYAGI